MHAIAHGIDIVEITRIGELRAEHGERFLERCFTAEERAYCVDRRRAEEHLAARFAAKEAVLKALGLGLRAGMQWTDVVIVRDHEGAPGVVLHGRAAEIAAEKGIQSWLISLSHTTHSATASVIGLGPG